MKSFLDWLNRSGKVTKNRVNIRPKAALYLTNLINQINKHGYFFEASRKFHIINKIDAKYSGITLYGGLYDTIVAVSYTTLNDEIKHVYIKDLNLQGSPGYNDWFCFATKHEAKKYVHAKFVK